MGQKEAGQYPRTQLARRSLHELIPAVVRFLFLSFSLLSNRIPWKMDQDAAGSSGEVCGSGGGGKSREDVSGEQ